MQRGFAQKIIKSYRTVSLNAALVLSGLLPLDIRIQEAAELYEAKRGKPQQTIGDREIESRVCYLKAPHPAEGMECDFTCLEDMLPETLKNQQIEGSFVFTDGSKIEGKVGAALSYWRDGSEILSRKFKLEFFCTVFQAEMYALFRATEIALKGNDEKINIFSDSRSALELLKDSGSSYSLACRIKNNMLEIQKKGKTLKLFWVRAHFGVEGCSGERSRIVQKIGTRLRSLSIVLFKKNN